MGYLGNVPATGSDSSFKLLDDIKTYTLTFNGSSSNVISTANNTITKSNHRFITGQSVTYTHGGGGVIGGLTSGTVYYVIKNDTNTFKLATNTNNVNSGTAINLTGLGTGSAHTLNVAFDGINTKFKASYDGGTEGKISRAAQLTVSINGVIQQPFDTLTPTSGFGIDSSDSVIIFSTPPEATDAFWGYTAANNTVTFDITDNKVDNFTGNGVLTSFNLSREPPNNENILVTLDGVIQYPSDGATTRAYSVTGPALDFTAPPGNGVEIQVRHIGFAGASTSGVTGVYGRTGNVSLEAGDVLRGDGSLLTGISAGKFVTDNAGIHTTISVGVNTTGLQSNTPLTGIGNSLQGVYISNGMIVVDNVLSGNHYIGTSYNGIMGGPVTITGVLSVDGNYVVV